jgi:hypothetical protein
LNDKTNSFKNNIHGSRILEDTTLLCIKFWTLCRYIHYSTNNNVRLNNINLQWNVCYCRNTLGKVVESEMNKAALEETSTSKNKRGQGSSKKNFLLLLLNQNI